MSIISREQLEALLIIKSDKGEFEAEAKIHLPIIDKEMDLYISISDAAGQISDKSLAAVNDVLSLSEMHLEKIRKLLFDHAIEASNTSAYGDPEKREETLETGFLSRLFKRKQKVYRFVPLEISDPRHPCYFEKGIESVDGKMEWKSIFIDENANVSHRFAVLYGYPEWEYEHGVTIVIRDGVPIGVGEYDPDLSHYDSD